MLQCDQKSSKDDSDTEVFKGSMTILNDKGLHTRPSTELVKCACKFKSQINLILGDILVNGKSILGILMLAACEGTSIDIEARGPDAQAAIKALQELAKEKFNINY